MIEKLVINNFRCFNKTSVDELHQINLFTGKNNAGKTSLLEAIYSITNSINLNLISNTKNIRKLNEYNLSDDEIFKNLTYRNNGEKIVVDASFSNYKYPLVSFEFDGPRSFHYKAYIAENQFSYAIMDINFTAIFLLERKEQIPKLDNITKLYDNAEIAGMKNIFLDAVKIIDNEIEELRTFSSRQNALFYRKKGDPGFYLIDYLGDAAKKIIIIIANIVFHFLPENSHEKILIIDEIENGLHYSVQGEFWRILIELCLKYKIQLFATTHSKEMLEAYCQLSNKFEKSQAYFELVKNYEEDIICINHSMDLLEYELQKDENVRG